MKIRYKLFGELSIPDGSLETEEVQHITSEIRKTYPEVTSAWFGACYDFIDKTRGWSRLTYITGNTPTATVVLGVCDYRPSRYGQMLF